MQAQTELIVTYLQERLPLPQDMLFMAWNWSAKISPGGSPQSPIWKALKDVLETTLVIPLNKRHWEWFKQNLLHSPVSSPSFYLPLSFNFETKKHKIWFEEFEGSDEFPCICGLGLKKEKYKKPKDENAPAVACNGCAQVINKKGTELWRCKEVSVHHPDGYVICDSCAKTGLSFGVKKTVAFFFLAPFSTLANCCVSFLSLLFTGSRGFAFPPIGKDMRPCFGDECKLSKRAN